MTKRPMSNAERCRRYRRRLKSKGIEPITLLAPIHAHSELRRLARDLRKAGTSVKPT